MKITCDPKYNIAYISFREKTARVETLHVSDSVNIDITPDGTIYGIELLNAKEQLGDIKDRKSLVVNIATTKKTKANSSGKRSR
ncbi:MAG: DUF2283 domain-containing protein [Candidatus Omnitrophica bacterium]|nr:DUF2283 domain-containing protein [Candidatus Omnitrophota bacterium]